MFWNAVRCRCDSHRKTLYSLNSHGGRVYGTAAVRGDHKAILKLMHNLPRIVNQIGPADRDHGNDDMHQG
jgi:hypothetical protein